MWDDVDAFWPDGFCCAAPLRGAYPMTMHAILLTAKRDAMVWLSDRFAFLGQGAYGTVEKVTYLKNRKTAFSAWGDQIALAAKDEFGKRLEKGSISMSDQRQAIEGLLQLATDMDPKDECSNQKQAGPLSPRGLLVAHFSDTPQVYRLNITSPPLVSLIHDLAVAGDPFNPAASFVDYYGRLMSRENLGALLLMGVHILRIAEAANSRAIRGIDAWIFQNEVFRELTLDEIEVYMASSRAIDHDVLEQFRNAPLWKQ